MERLIAYLGLAAAIVDLVRAVAELLCAVLKSAQDSENR